MRSPTPTKKYILSLALVTAFFLSGCIHDDFEEPALWDIPQGEVISVSQLRSLFSGEPVRFTEDYSVFATVTMDDKSGNIYRSAYIQDETGAINLRLVAPGGLYRGDSVRLYLKGTTLSSYQRLLQLEDVNVDRNIQKIDVKKEVTPAPATISEIRTAQFQGQLVRLNNVQFMAADTGKTFADSQRLTTENRMLEDCSGNRIIVRTSGYANFADVNVPDGMGSLIAVVSQFQNDMQLLIRDMAEVQLNDERCPVPGDDYELIGIAGLRQDFNGGQTAIPGGSRIEGVVISDNAHENHPGQNLFLMDESGAGIALRFSTFHDFPLGSRIRVIFSSPMPLGLFNGLLQIGNIPIGNAYDLGPGVLPPPRDLTIEQAINQADQYQSTLVRISNATISGGPTFAQSPILSDGTGQILLFTHNWASFAENSVPSGTLRVTGILSVYNNPQILIRNLDDINEQ
ncbi:MAG: DUF5689 domain-containing protein [Bacteroidales bacterium]